MEIEETDDNVVSNCEESHSACSAVNNLILDYYKKFGKKRDLEQFFSLSTAQSEVRDPCSLFWRRMKSQDESSDSGGKKSESSTELCRISIQCSIPEPSTSQTQQSRVKSDSESPPIISEDVIAEATKNSDNESIKSDDVQSLKSIDGTLDTSTNKPHSPTSSITSQRKLEWDSLADVGYANESERKNSASSLSTLERLALQQQYSYNDTKNTDIGPPTAQSTPLDANESKSKNKKGAVKKTTKIYKKDIDSVQLSIPQNHDINPQPINLNLTKHISFNVDRSGGVVIEHLSKNVSLSPEKVSVETEVTPQIKMDKEIQTTLNRSKDKLGNSDKKIKDTVKRFPVLISLNSLKKKSKKKKVRRVKRQIKKRLIADKENFPLEKSGDQLSEAESFEYMPGHIYNQNHMKYNERKNNVPDNKSSLESSGLTTDSSKTAKYSFTKDLEKSIDILKTALDQKHEDVNLRKNLIKDIVQRLVESKYIGDKSSTEFLSGLSFNSKRLGFDNHNYTTTSTSDTNNTANDIKQSKPKKSILRMDKFNTNPIASTSQSVPNIPIFTKERENLLGSKIRKSLDVSNTDSDIKNKALSDVGVDKISSEELYKKYLDALKREQAYKMHLKDKENFLKQKLVSSNSAYNVTRQVDDKAQNKIKGLMKDLIRNNYDDGSGDASKLEGGSSVYINREKTNSLRKQKSHSVFTLSSGTSEQNCTKSLFKNKLQHEVGSSKIDSNFERHYCCCPLHALCPKVGVADSSVQVNIKSCTTHASENIIKKSVRRNSKIHETEQPKCHKCKSPPKKIVAESDSASDDVKYVCLCTDKRVISQEMPENFLIYKCSKLPSKTLKLDDIVPKAANTANMNTSNFTSPQEKISSFKSQDCERKCLIIKDSTSSNNQTSKSSQTNLNLPIVLHSINSHQSVSSTSSRNNEVDILGPQNTRDKFINEATRCIQTEISIDPKKSDPSLSDLNIVKDENCVELISEQFKKASHPSAGASIDNKFDAPVQSSGSSLPESIEKFQILSDKCVSTSAEDEFTTVVNKLDRAVQSSPDNITNNNTNRVNDRQYIKKITIPIQGTNMTLKVSLGSGTDSSPSKENKFIKDLKSNTTFLTQGTETMKPCVIENATSLQEECSKAIQTSNMNIFEDTMERNQNSSKSACVENRNTYSDNYDSQTSTNKKNYVPSKLSNVNTSVNTNYKYNTYPTEDRSHVHKPLLRSNTDPSKIENACHVTFHQRTRKTDKDDDLTSQKQLETISTKQQEKAVSCGSELSKSIETSCKSKLSLDTDKQFKSFSSETEDNIKVSAATAKDPILDIIQDITMRYSKKDIGKSKRKKCFKEIISVLNYLLDTEESTDRDQNKASSSSCDYDADQNLPDREGLLADSVVKAPVKASVDKAVQLSTKKSKSHKTESSDIRTSTDIPSTSSDAATCKVLNKIKRECEKYHQRRCKLHTGGKKCEESSSTSVNCDQCRRVHHCPCRHKCKSYRTKTAVEKTMKKCVAYNLIIQTSDSVVSEDINCESSRRQLQNIIVKVPSKRKVENVPFKEMAAKIERDMAHTGPRCNTWDHRSKILPNDSEISSTDEIIKKAQDYTVREFLEKNRPDFVEKSSNRQECLKLISESRPRQGCPTGLNMILVHPPTCNGNSIMETCNVCCGGIPMNNCNVCTYSSIPCIQNEIAKIASERAAKKHLLSLQLDSQQALNALSESDLKDFAKAFGDEIRRKRVAPKFINEREMKKHSEKIYKSLPEVVHKKEEIKKENIKKANLLMANIFKKNLQKKALRGTINISNYSSVIKI